ncbi:hypothetical protein HanXRQr2_Chr16g0762041 [Helianthus annuus]|uniref:Uncharacterized protein n=1 Tax=Helianthus annuus TaxID=4232 RepID=A0A251S1U1_HELAN|nr:hypothetical protein HanXRQr2_Chr16g0762041 [Helianthus annuus]KAJ0439083.1 hypothetical protein HanHA300_Chr16g0621271 [Helianthus annuus]KAJ0444065.1 hypothetical protein HanIR_Chr16g0827671 [Helianthus annuus]KAJ0914181.1 hypothetical protein HanPSC8_Chr06g0235711 [Helianthus annuus]
MLPNSKKFGWMLSLAQPIGFMKFLWDVKNVCKQSKNWCDVFYPKFEYLNSYVPCEFYEFVLVKF